MFQEDKILQFENERKSKVHENVQMFVLVATQKNSKEIRNIDSIIDVKH